MSFCTQCVYSLNGNLTGCDALLYNETGPSIKEMNIGVLSSRQSEGKSLEPGEIIYFYELEISDPLFEVAIDTPAVEKSNRKR